MMKTTLPTRGARRTFSVLGLKYSIECDFDRVWTVRDLRDEGEPVCLIFSRHGGHGGHGGHASFIIEAAEDDLRHTPDWWKTLKSILRHRAEPLTP